MRQVIDDLRVALSLQSSYVRERIARVECLVLSSGPTLPEIKEIQAQINLA